MHQVKNSHKERKSQREKLPPNKKTKKKEEEEEGRLPSTLGSNLPSPSPVIFQNTFRQYFFDTWGRPPNSRELKQLKDLQFEIYTAAVTDKQIHDAFKEAAVQNKLHVSYVRAVLLAWLGIERNRSP